MSVPAEPSPGELVVMALVRTLRELDYDEAETFRVTRRLFIVLGKMLEEMAEAAESVPRRFDA